ncbi:MAG: BACON domain-containing protein, partial [Bacteroidales bacterium]|nr:BACON domain-containing protein [Bacteroidales bacterium]
MTRTILLMSALLLFATVSCRQSAENEGVEWRTDLQVDKSDLIFFPAGGVKTLEVNTSSVTVKSDKEWATVSVSGNVVTVNVAPYTGNQSRYAQLTITSGSENINASVIQYGEVFDGLQLEDVVVPVEGATFAYSYKANMDVSISSDQSWVQIKYDEEDPQIVYVIVDKNEGFGTRFATVSYTAGSKSGSMLVTQAPTFAPVQGWTIADTDGYYDFPNQIDFITVTPPSNDKYYLFEVFSPDVMPSGDAAAWISEAADETSATILALLAQGEIQSVGDILLKGKQSEQFENLPSTSKGLVICFDDKGYPTGEYVLVDVAVPDRGPVKQQVEGWDIVHSAASYVYPTQTDVFTVTPKAGYENARYIATVVSKDAV